MICKWHEIIIDQVCLNPDCRKQSLICQRCWEEHHERHPSISLQKYRSNIEKYLCKFSKKNFNQSLTPDCKLTYSKLKSQFQNTVENIHRQNEKYARMVEFIENLNSQLLDLQYIGETEHLNSIFQAQLDRQRDIDLDFLNEMILKFFLHIKIQRVKDPETGLQDIQLIPSIVSSTRPKILVQKRSDFSKIINKKIIDQEEQFEKFLKDIGEIINKEKELVIPKEQNQLINLEFQDTDFDYEGFKKKTISNRAQFKLEDCRDLLSFEIVQPLDALDVSAKGDRQMIKFCHYLLFYTNVHCEETLDEPIIKAVDAKKQSKPISCELCKLMKSKSFVEFYYRFDLIKRFGKLCKFTDKSGRIIWIHEMCLLWTNRVNVDPKFNTVDVQSLYPAVQYAEQQMCRYCSSEGAGSKCNQPECQVHLHFHCIKLSKLRGLQFDLQEKYRFYCEDHHKKLNNYGRSEWFMTRDRLKKLVAKNGLDKKQKNNMQNLKIEMESSNSYMEEETRKPKKRRNKQ